MPLQNWPARGCGSVAQCTGCAGNHKAGARQEYCSWGRELPSAPFTGTATKIVHSVFIAPQSTPKGLVISVWRWTHPSRAKNENLLRTPDPDLVSDAPTLHQQGHFITSRFPCSYLPSDIWALLNDMPQAELTIVWLICINLDSKQLLSTLDKSSWQNCLPSPSNTQQVTQNKFLSSSRARSFETFASLNSKCMCIHPANTAENAFVFFKRKVKQASDICFK